MPGIDELLHGAGEQWRAEVDPRGASEHRPAPHTARAWDSPRTRLWATGGALAAAAVVVLAVGLAGGSGSDDRAGSSSASAFSAESRGKVAAGGGASSAAGAIAPASRSSSAGSTALIETGSLSLTVASGSAVDTAATRATGITDAAGGRVDDDARSSDGQRSATLVLRVPNAALSGVTAQLSALGRVSARNLQTKDVTSQVADVNSRVISARAAIAALNRLYAKAQSTKDLITIESALASRQSNLEALEAQQRSLAAQTSLATLTVSITVRPAPPTAKHSHRSGFTGGLHSGWHAFTTAAHALATAAGAVLPFAVLALVLGAAVVGHRRRRV